jgi:ubiquinone/menaquinone biosynthesis C-methylase UbiE
MGDPTFRSDLFRGTASYYDQFRVPYPQSLLDDLARRSGADGAGSLLDLACGPGLIGFALRGRFREVWAVDQEPDMIDVARQKAATADTSTFRFATSAAEDLSVPEDSFDLIAIGNAFHRMQREKVAAHALRWLRPGGHLALLWGGSPWDDDRAPWQRAMAQTVERWRSRAQGLRDRVPAGYAENRQRRPDLEILRAAGFEPAGTHRFPVPWEWTPDTLIGFAYSTSVLSREALGDLAPGFEEDLRHAVCACEPSGVLRQSIEFAYELARRPA